ncbi:hypothetical protein E4U12_007511 [Claviceps purpurea]|nr:hypothetical protein E4U12_007511 [Claviceps purpurea]
MTDCAALPPRQRWIFVQDSLAEPIQKRLAHYFESGEARGWDANAFVDYLDTLYADNTTIAVARLEPDVLAREKSVNSAVSSSRPQMFHSENLPVLVYAIFNKLAGVASED